MIVPIDIDVNVPTIVFFCQPLGKAIRVDIIGKAQLQSEIQAAQDGKILHQATIDTLTPIFLQVQQAEIPPITP